MSKYTANKNIAFKGELIKKGEEIELTAEQAGVLGKKVTALESEQKEPSLSDNTVPELKALAEGLEIDGFEGMKKPELIQAIEEKQKVEA